MVDTDPFWLHFNGSKETYQVLALSSSFLFFRLRGGGGCWGTQIGERHAGLLLRFPSLGGGEGLTRPGERTRGTTLKGSQKAKIGDLDPKIGTKTTGALVVKHVYPYPAEEGKG